MEINPIGVIPSVLMFWYLMAKMPELRDAHGIFSIAVASFIWPIPLVMIIVAYCAGRRL